LKYRFASFAWYESDPERRVFIAQSNGRSRVVYSRRKAPKSIEVTNHSTGRTHTRRINAISETFEEAEARVVRATEERAATARNQLRGFINRNQLTLAPSVIPASKAKPFVVNTRRLVSSSGSGRSAIAIGGSIALGAGSAYMFNKNNKKK
jgi:RecA-family ATPase